MKVPPQAHGAAPGSIAGLEIGASGAGEEEGALVGLLSGGRKVRIISSQAFPNLVGQGGPLQLRLPTLGPRQ